MTSITTILGVRITYIYRGDDLPYCEFIRLAEREIREVEGQIAILEDQLLNLPTFLVTEKAQKALSDAKIWYVDAIQDWSIWRNMYAELSIKGKAYMTLNQLIRYHNEAAIPFYHPSGAHRAEVYLAMKLGGFTVEEAIAGVMQSFCLCDCWQEQRTKAWKEVLS